MEHAQRANLYISLPQSSGQHDHTEQITALLKQSLPAKEQKTLKQELHWHFPLEKQQPSGGKRIRNRRRVRKGGPAKTKPDEAVHEMEKPDSGWSYAALVPVRDMWREYIRRCIGKPGENTSLRLTLSKCEFIGAEMTVEKSTTTSMVGLSGIIVRETQKLFEIVDKKSEYKKIPKRSTVLSFMVGPMQITVIGKHFMTRPAERSVKKIKSLMFADI